ncbi:MAG: acetyl-CoA C-acetyltransferase, partial [Paraglaciecola sp.]|nr:acetyl-CoA C-acetyltransferase [Paraglaciecola sp.]
MSDNSVVIVAAKRTPMGGFMGALSSLTSPNLGAEALKATIDAAGGNRAAVNSSVDEVILGCVLPAGLGQSPTRQASIAAQLPLASGVTTIN